MTPTSEHATGLPPDARRFFVIGAALAALAVAAGAFGAHALRATLDDAALANWETAARYQMYHALALLAVAWATTRMPGRLSRAAGWLFVAGVAIFSGSLFLLSLTGVKVLGAITPIGGVALIAGWVCLVIAALRR